MAVTSAPAPGPWTTSGVRRVPLRGERDDVVAPFGSPRRDDRAGTPAAPPCPPVLQNADVAQHLAPRAGARLQAAAISTSYRAKAEKKRARKASPRERAGTRLSTRHVVDVHLQPDLAGEDQQLARDVLPGQILARIGLGEPQLVRACAPAR